MTYLQKTKKSVRFQDQQLFQLESKHNLFTHSATEYWGTVECSQEHALIAAMVMVEANARGSANGFSIAQQHLLKKGLKKFGDRGYQAAHKEMDQLHNRSCFAPIDISTLSPTEKRKAQEALLFLTEKRDKSIKGRMVYNGKPTVNGYPERTLQVPLLLLRAFS